MHDERSVLGDDGAADDLFRRDRRAVNLDRLHALAARELRQLTNREQQQLAFAGRRGNAIAIDIEHALRSERRRALIDVHDGLPRFAIGDQILEPRNEAVAVISRQQPEFIRIAHHDAGERCTGSWSEKRGQRLTVTLR